MKIQFHSLTPIILAAALIPHAPSLATTTSSPLPQTLTPSTTKLASNNELRTTAQKITVRVTSANNGGSGVLVARKGNTYLVLTNRHVTRRDRQFKIATADGKQHTATLLPNTKIDPKYDLSLLQFTSTNTYQLANIKDNLATPFDNTTKIYSAGYPYDSEQLRLSGGNVSQISDLPLEDGTQLGYVINANEKGVRQGMSGGPILDAQGVLVGINTISVAPLSPSYRYSDGSKPTAKKSAQYQQANWGVPIYNLLTQLNPNILYAYDNLPKVPNQVTPTGYMAKLNRDTRQQTVRIEAGGGNGSGVIIAKERTPQGAITYSVLTNRHVVQSRGSKQLFTNIKTITFDQESYQIDPNSITIDRGQDLAVVKFTSTANYPVAQLSSIKPRRDDITFVGGYPGRDNINSPLWQWQLNPGKSLGQDLGEFSVRNNDSFTEGYNLVYTNITYSGMSGGPVFDTQGRVIGLHGSAEEGDRPPELMLGNSLGISIKSFIASAGRLKVNPQLLKISRDVPRYLTATELKTVTDVRDNLPEPDSNTNAKQWLMYGGQLNRIGEYKKAVAAFDKAIAIDRTNYLLTGTYGKARAYDELGRLEAKSDFIFPTNENRKVDDLNRAVALYKAAIAIVPPDKRKENYFLWNKQAELLLKLNKYDEALQANQQAIDLNPTDRTLYLNRAYYYEIAKNYDRAIAIYDRLIQQEPDVASLYVERGKTRNSAVSIVLSDRAILAKTHKAAILDFDKAIQLDPEYTDAYKSRSSSKSYLKDFKGALEDINLAISYNPREPWYYLLRGNIKSDSGDDRGAISDHTQTIALYPQNYLSYSLRGLAKYNLKDYQGAMADHDRSIAINPKGHMAYAGRGSVKSALKDYQGAIADYTQAIELNAKYPHFVEVAGASYNYYNSRGIDKYNLKDYRGAIADQTQAIAINPKGENAYRSRGLAKIDLKDYQGAIADFTQVIAIDPKDDNAYLMRGLTKHNLKDYQGAIADFTQAIVLNPKDDNAYRSRGLAKNDLQDYQGAIADLTQSIVLNPKNDNSYGGRGLAKFGLKDYQGSIPDFTQAIALNPKNDLYYRLRGFAKFNLKDYRGAIPDFTQSIAINSKDNWAYAGRGDTKLNLKDYQGAIFDYTQSLALNPKKGNVYNARGYAKSQLGDYQGATADTERAIAIDPKNDNPYNSRGVYKFLTNDNRGALADWEQAMKLNPQNAYAYANRGLLSTISGERQAGSADIERSIKLNQNIANSYAIRGLIRTDAGDRSGAISDYKQALKLDPQIVDKWTKDANQLRRVNNLAAYQTYQRMIQGLTAQK